MATRLKISDAANRGMPAHGCCLPLENAFSELLAALGAVAPEELVALLRGQLDQITRGSHASLLTLRIIGAIRSSSAVMGADLVYHFAPNRAARWARITPGALVAAVLCPYDI